MRLIGESPIRVEFECSPLREQREDSNFRVVGQRARARSADCLTRKTQSAQRSEAGDRRRVGGVLVAPRSSTSHRVARPARNLPCHCEGGLATAAIQLEISDELLHRCTSRDDNRKG